MRLLRQSLPLLLPACLMLAPLSGCQSTAVPTGVAHAVAGSRTLVIQPRFDAYHTQSTVAPYAKANINHLVLQLYTVANAVESQALDGNDQPIALDVANADLAKTVSFTNLKPNTTYRVKALAYKATGTAAADLISTQDASSYVDVTVADDDRPTMSQLKVQLIDRNVSMKLTGSNTLVTSNAGTPVEATPRVAYNPTNDEYLVVWQDNRSGNNAIYGRRVAADGTALGSDFAICTTGADMARPVVAYSADAGGYLVAWEHKASGLGNYDIYGQRVNAGGTLAGTSFGIGYASGDQTTPTVAYSPRDQEFLVAWCHGPTTDIRGRLVGINGGLIGNELQLATNGGASYNPALTYNSTDFEFLLVWQDNATNQYDIYGRRFDGHGILIGSSFQLTSRSGIDTSPSVAYNPQQNRYFVAWQSRASLSGDNDLYGQHFDATGKLLGTTVGQNVALCTASGDQKGVSVAYNASSGEYLVAWQDNRGGNYDVYAERVGAAGTTPGAELAIATGALDQIAPWVAHNTQENEWFVTWSDGDIYRQRVDSYCAN